MAAMAYEQRRAALLTYFDRTAAEAWSRLTSDAPLGRIRASVRAGRDEMRATLLSYLPGDLAGARLLDAGCGTGALAVEAARRGAAVTAIDLSPTLVNLARERSPEMAGEIAGEMAVPGHVDFQVGDMCDAACAGFDHVVAMDSLIHYATDDMVDALARVAPNVRRSLLFTIAPRTPLLAAMHAVGKLFPRGDRSPAIEPVAPARLRRQLARDPRFAAWRVGRTHRVARGFYISEAVELVRV